MKEVSEPVSHHYHSVVAELWTDAQGVCAIQVYVFEVCIVWMGICWNLIWNLSCWPVGIWRCSVCLLLVHILEHGFAGPVPWLLLFPMFSLLDLTDCLAERIIKFQSFQNLRYVV